MFDVKVAGVFESVLIRRVVVACAAAPPQDNIRNAVVLLTDACMELLFVSDLHVCAQRATTAAYSMYITL